MPRRSRYEIDLREDERAVLESLARSYSSPYRDVIRAKIVLLAATGMSNEEIAHRLDTRREIVSKWRKRYYEEGIQGLAERARSGRPPTRLPVEGHERRQRR